MIGIVSCSAKKLGRAAPARELYTSHLFKLSLEYAERHCEHVYIASSRHGLVALAVVLEPYNDTLTSKPRAVRDAWGFMFCEQLYARHPNGGRLLVLAGEAYVAPIRRHLSPHDEVFDVLHGMQIGQRLQFLRQRLDARRAA